MRWAWGLPYCLGCCLACSSSTDVAAVVFDDVEASEALDVDRVGWSPDAGVDAAVFVTGRPTPRYAFEILSWPLQVGLDEFFSSGAAPNGRRIEVEGEDALALLELLEAQSASGSPPRRSVAVEDDLGALYLVVIQRRASLDD